MMCMPVLRKAYYMQYRTEQFNAYGFTLHEQTYDLRLQPLKKCRIKNKLKKDLSCTLHFYLGK